MALKKIIPADYIAAAAAAVLGVSLLAQSGTVSEGIRDGLEICAGVLIPALFPFMALSGFLALTNAAKILSFPLAPVTVRLFKLPSELGAIVLLSMVGGYPVGAKSVASLLSRGKISRKTAERMLCFCVNCGPSFLISAVGAGMLFNKTAGVILFISQTLATILIGAVVSFKAKVPRTEAPVSAVGIGPAFVEAVSGAASATLTMCSFAVLFSGILSLVASGGLIKWLAQASGLGEAVVKAAVCGLFEVTSGCLNSAAVGGETGFALISAMVSFGGLSVLFQIFSCFRDNSVNFRGMLISRAIHIPLSLIFAMPFYRFFCGEQSVFAPTAEAVIRTDGRTSVITVCLLCMCAIITLSEPHRRF